MSKKWGTCHSESKLTARIKRKLWGFDSFQGFPEPSVFDLSPRNPQKGEWCVDQTIVSHRLETSGVNEKNFPGLETNIIKGFFDKILLVFPKNRCIAFLHIDADLYQSYKDVLAQFFSRVSIGGVVVFDEYREFPLSAEYGKGTIQKWPGCTKAVDDFFENRPEKIQCDELSKKYYVIKFAD